MTGTLIFDPLVPWALLLGLGGLAAAGLGLAGWRRLAGTGWRALALAVLVLALAGPVYQSEERAALDDIVVLVEDVSASQTLSDRASLTAGAAEDLAARVAARPNTTLHRVRVGDAPDNRGTLLMHELGQALAELPANRIAGVIVLSDGRIHDLEQTPEVPAPVHLLHTGAPGDWDRRLTIETAPGFGILDEEVTIRLRLEDDGAAPGDRSVPLDIALDGERPVRVEVPLGRSMEMPLKLTRAGHNVVQISTPLAEGELTGQNNTALVQINGVRDRLRVLLVSGEPYQGERTWRNLLKSDSSVDLVHFTILRPPEKQDGVPIHELSLIAFPTRELFMDKIDDFDLIIFDRYKRRGILPALYLENVRRYVTEGGALLIATGPDFAAADSLYRTPLRDILPGAPTARVVEEPFLPQVTELGQRHPVTAGLQRDETPDWGRWMRQIELEPVSGEVVMSGADARPLLLLDRQGEGRVALLASDQAWLWHRGFEGGGPQMELLRRLAHWLMKEPELEEDALWAEADGQSMRIIRRSLQNSVGDVEVTTPGRDQITLPLTETSPGQFEARYEGPEVGLYHLASDSLRAVVGLGPASPVEYAQTIADPEALAELQAVSGGGAVAVREGTPRLRDVRSDVRAFGRGWIGITPRGAYETLSVRQLPLLPVWLALLLISGLVLAGWLREGRR